MIFASTVIEAVQQLVFAIFKIGVCVFAPVGADCSVEWLSSSAWSLLLLLLGDFLCFSRANLKDDRRMARC